METRAINPCARNSQFATNRSGSAPQFYSLSLSGEKVRAQIAIAKPINRELAPVDDFQQLGVDLGKGVQGAIASAFPAYRLANFGSFFAKWRRIMHSRQRPAWRTRSVMPVTKGLKSFHSTPHLRR